MRAGTWGIAPGAPIGNCAPHPARTAIAAQSLSADRPPSRADVTDPETRMWAPPPRWLPLTTKAKPIIREPRPSRHGQADKRCKYLRLRRLRDRVIERSASWRKALEAHRKGMARRH